MIFETQRIRDVRAAVDAYDRSVRMWHEFDDGTVTSVHALMALIDAGTPAETGREMTAVLIKDTSEYA